MAAITWFLMGILDEHVMSLSDDLPRECVYSGLIKR